MPTLHIPPFSKPQSPKIQTLGPFLGSLACPVSCPVQAVRRLPTHQASPGCLCSPLLPSATLLGTQAPGSPVPPELPSQGSLTLPNTGFPLPLELGRLCSWPRPLLHPLDSNTLRPSSALPPPSPPRATRHPPRQTHMPTRTAAALSGHMSPRPPHPAQTLGLPTSPTPHALLPTMQNERLACEGSGCLPRICPAQGRIKAKLPSGPGPSLAPRPPSPFEEAPRHSAPVAHGASTSCMQSRRHRTQCTNERESGAQRGPHTPKPPEAPSLGATPQRGCGTGSQETPRGQKVLFVQLPFSPALMSPPPGSPPGAQLVPAHTPHLGLSQLLCQGCL